MSVVIVPRVTDLTIYFYDEGKSWNNKDHHRAVIQGSYIVGRPHAIELTGGTGRIETGDDIELIKQLKAHGFEYARLEVKCGTKVNKHLRKCGETEHTEIYDCDLRKF